MWILTVMKNEYSKELSSGLILGLRPANERQRYFGTSLESVQ